MAIYKEGGKPGFTIVELLIVVVIIAILAAITIVTYSGIQQRASNTAIIDAASKSLRMIQSYIAVNGTYPIATSLCITTTSGCENTSVVISGNSTFDTNMKTVGTLPRDIPTPGPDRYGIIYDYMSNRTMNGQAQPYVLQYYLPGVNQPCGLSGVADSFGPTMLPSSTGYTAGNSGGTSGKTACIISIPGPAS